jgi:hypothetical protein
MADQRETGPVPDEGSQIIPKRHEQIITVTAGLAGIITPLAGFVSGASMATVSALTVLSFVVLVIAGFFLIGRNAALARICLGLGASVIAALLVLQIYRGGMLSSAVAPESSTLTEIKPPIMTVEAWIDQPTLERAPNGSIVNVAADGKKGWSERYIAPVEVWTPDRPNAELLRRIPGYFNTFEPGEKVYASVCGMEVSRETLKRDDKDYSDQMTFSIPVPASAASNCGR